MELVDLMNEVLLETGRAKVTEPSIDNGSLTTDEEMVLMKINNEAQELFEEWDWARLKHVCVDKGVVEEGEARVELTGKDGHPPDPYKIDSIYISTNEWDELDEISDEDFDDVADEIPRFDKEPDWYRLLHVNDTGNPIIELYPTPNASYDLKYRYYERFEKMDNSADIVPLFDRVIKWGSVASVLRYDGEAAQYAIRKYQSALTRAKQQNEPNKDIVVGGNVGTDKRDRSDFDFDKPLGE